MVVKNIIDDMWPNIWPIITFISIVAITLRCLYLFKGSRKFVLHKEILYLVFIIYILCLYYILIGQDKGTSGINIIPFKEMFRYQFGSYKFIKNVVGNIVLFIPLGFFSSLFLNNKKAGINIISTLLISFGAEGIQYYIGRVFDIDDIILNVLGGFIGYLLFIGLNAIRSKLPKFMRSDAFINFIVIFLIVIIVLVSMKIKIFNLF